MNGAPHDASDARSGRLLLALALLSGAGLMSPLWFAGPLSLDEHCSYWIVAGPSGGSICTRSLQYAATPPLSSWMQRLSLAAFGKSEFAFRLPSALCYLAAIGMTFLVGTTLDSRTTGGLAALLVAWHPEALQDVRLARPYGLLLLLSAMLLWGAACWWARPASRWGPALVVVSAIALLWTHYVAVLLLATVGGALLMARGSSPAGIRPRRVHVLGAGLVIALATLPLLPAVQRMAEWSPFLNYRQQAPPLSELVGPVWWSTAAAALVVSLLPGRRTADEQASGRRLTLIAAAWGLLPVLVLALLAHGDLTSLANPRYRVPFVVGGSCCITAIIRWRAPRDGWAIAACTVVIIFAWWIGGVWPWDLGRLNDPLAAEWKDLAERIDRAGRAGEPVFVQGGLIESSLVPAMYDDQAFLEYVACRTSRFYLESEHPRIGLPFLWDQQSGVTDAFRQRLQNLPASGHRSFWLACALDTDLNRNSCDGLQRLAAQAGYEVVAEEKYPQTLLQRYDIGDDIRPADTTNLEFGMRSAE